MKDSPLPPSVQFHDNLGTIAAMLERRFSLRRIWKKLKEEDKYTGDYTHFCKLAKREFGVKKKPEERKAKIQTSPRNFKEEGSTTIAEVKIDSVDTEDEDEDGPLMFMGDLSSPKKK